MEGLEDALAAHDYNLVSTRLGAALDTARDPVAVQWCMTHGLNSNGGGGHVLALYRVVRNLLKFQVGRVATPKDLSFGVMAAAVLLIRCAQDVTSCKEDMAKAGLECVFTFFRDKIIAWVLAQPLGLVEQATVHREVGKWFETAAATGADLPSPVWVTAFGVPMIGWTCTWGNPAPHDVAAFARCRGIQETRTRVAGRMVQALLDAPSLAAFFAIDL